MAFDTLPSPSRHYLYSEDDFDGHRAAPLLIVGPDRDFALSEAQDRLAHTFDRLVHAELGGRVRSESVVDFVARSIVSRMQQREGSNGISYMHRANRLPNTLFDPTLSKEAILDASEAAKYGRGSVLQNEIARRAFGMTSVEYANLTIIGEARRQLEPKMWEDVGRLTESDVTPQPDQPYRFEVLGFDRDIRRDLNIGAMRIGMKRRLGETQYGAHVKTRTTAIVRPVPLFRETNISGMSPRDIIVNFQEKARAGAPLDDSPEFHQAVRWLVGESFPPELVLARNETVYGSVANAPEANQ